MCCCFYVFVCLLCSVFYSGGLFAVVFSVGRVYVVKPPDTYSSEIKGRAGEAASHVAYGQESGEKGSMRGFCGVFWRFVVLFRGGGGLHRLWCAVQKAARRVELW